MLLQPAFGGKGNRPIGLPIINRESPHAVKLEAWLPAYGGVLIDVLRGLVLTGTRVRQGNTLGGQSFKFNATGEGAEITTPSYLQLPFPLTVAAWVIATATAGASASIFGVTHNNTDSAPFLSYHLGFDGSSNIVLDGNNGGTYATIGGGPLTSFVPALVAGVFGPAAQGALLFKNGLQVANTSSFANPTYGASSLLHAGNYTGVSRNSNILFLDGRIWSRAFTAAEMWELYEPSTRWDLYWRPSMRTIFDMGAPINKVGVNNQGHRPYPFAPGAAR